VAAAKMHADEVATDAELVRRLLESQFPDWAGLRIERAVSDGTDNAIYRLGDELAVRLPRIHWAAEQPEKEHRWLPRLAPLLPLPVPVPVAIGEPSEGYPWNWTIVPWLRGENATPERLDDPHLAAATLGEFVAALQRIEIVGGPTPARHNSSRGVPLAERDTAVRAAIEQLGDNVDARAVTAAWEAALAAPEWSGAPVWLHGDLQAGNLLAREGRLAAVIDFGCLGVGDPACDVMPAWAYLSGETRDVFRAAVPVDDATWARGRGWALSVGVIAIPYYEHTNPALAGIGRRAIDEVLADF
jgi:aminoglycoside phosphotransferase (APT) family kinase protein